MSRPVALWVVGPHGIGKSAVVREMLEAVTARPPYFTEGAGRIYAAGDYYSSPPVGPRPKKETSVVGWYDDHLRARSRALILEGPGFAQSWVLARLLDHEPVLVYLEGDRYAADRRSALGVVVRKQALDDDRAATERWATRFPGRTMRVLADARPRLLAAQLLSELAAHMKLVDSRAKPA